MKKILSINCSLIILLLCISQSISQPAPAPAPQRATCIRHSDHCFLRIFTCPQQCPLLAATLPGTKDCYVDCNSPSCTPVCRDRRPDCTGNGAACYDPRFVGGDGVVFYFRGKSNEHFSLVSDLNLQVNARFIGFRPAGRPHDYTWIQALGFLFGSHNFSLEATQATTWDDEKDHLKFSYGGNEVLLPERHLSSWISPERNMKLERISSKNKVILSIPGVLEVAVNVMPVTKDDDKIHKYQIPSDNCFAHLEIQFKFFSLSREVEGVLGRTYQPDFKNPAKPGVPMPVVGGEDRYRTTSLLSADCKSCLFTPTTNNNNNIVLDGEKRYAMDYVTLDCTGGPSHGNGIACKE